MGITASRLLELGLIDEIVPEPLGGAHRNVEEMAYHLQQALIKELAMLSSLSIEQLLDQRYQRLMSVGIQS